MRAIPAEYVCCVLEVKSTFNGETCKDAKDKLWELSPLLRQIDKQDEIYKQYLPVNFCMGVVFFEIQQRHKINLNAIKKLIPAKTTADLRGYFGGIILQAEGRDIELTGRISFGIGDDKIDEMGDLSQFDMVGNVKIPEGKYFSTMIIWLSVNFAIFAFDLVAIMNGTYCNGFVSSFHGMPFPINNNW